MNAEVMDDEQRRTRIADWVIAALILALLGWGMLGCTSPTGGSFAVARVESTGSVGAAFDANSYFVKTSGVGFVEVRSTTTGFPIWALVLEPSKVYIGHLTDPKYSWTEDIGVAVPAQAWTYVEALLTPAEIANYGLTQEAPTLNPPAEPPTMPVP